MQACLLLVAASTASAQMMAKPGHIGSGLSNAAWWQHAVFYQIQGGFKTDDSDFKAITARLDALKSLGVDALLLPAPDLPAPGTNGNMPNFDDLDNLLRRASAHGIRVLLTIHATSASQDLSGIARFWLSRGVAGLYIAAAPGTSPEDAQATAQKLRKLAATVAGQRIIISDLGTANVAQSPRSRASRTSDASAAQLQIDSRADRLPTLDAASLRPLLAQTQQNLLLKLHAPNSLAEAVAAIAVIAHPTALIDSSANLVLEPTPDHPEAAEQPAQPAPPMPPAPPPGTYLPYVPYTPSPKPRVAVAPKPAPIDPLTSWYRQLVGLNHDNAVLRYGSKTLLDFDAQNALVWVNRPASESVHTPPVVVVCNLSSSPLQFSLAEAIKSLNLHGFFLRTLLRSDQGMGAQDINAVTLPPFGVYIGELRR
jgi:glycosidase